MRRPPLALALALAFAATAGCAEQDGAFDPDGAGLGAEGGAFHLEGTLARGATQADHDAVRDIAERHGATVQMTAAEPPRFVLTGMTQAACESARAELEAIQGVDSVGTCSDLPQG